MKLSQIVKTVGFIDPACGFTAQLAQNAEGQWTLCLTGEKGVTFLFDNACSPNTIILLNPERWENGSKTLRLRAHSSVDRIFTNAIVTVSGLDTDNPQILISKEESKEN